MALDERIALTLYDRMLQVIAGAEPGSGLPSAFDSDKTMLVMAQRGLVINGANYRYPWSPGNAGRSYVKGSRYSAPSSQPAGSTGSGCSANSRTSRH
jgi:hypothetical protein